MRWGLKIPGDLKAMYRNKHHHQHNSCYNCVNFCIENGGKIFRNFKSQTLSGSIAFVLACFSILLNVTNGLKILHYSIPSMVDVTNVSSVTLDCIYSYDPGDVKLVVRWFHNDSPEPIYQWIPEPDIRYVSELIRPYFDMDFAITTDRYSKYRALRLDLHRHHNLPVALSGNYSCVISSIANQDTRQSQMIFYVPPKKFDFHFIELSMEKIALECMVDGVYPKPMLTFAEQYSSNYTYYQRSPSVNVSVTYNDPDSYLYSASFLYPINSVLTAGTIYECRLQLPGTNYVRKKRIKLIFPTGYVMNSGHQQHSGGASTTINAEIFKFLLFWPVFLLFLEWNSKRK